MRENEDDDGDRRTDGREAEAEGGGETEAASVLRLPSSSRIVGRTVGRSVAVGRSSLSLSLRRRPHRRGAPRPPPPLPPS